MTKHPLSFAHALSIVPRTFAVCTLLSVTAACGGGGGGSGDAPPQSPPGAADPPPANALELAVDLTPDQVIGGGADDADGNAALTLDLDNGALTGSVTVAGIQPSAVTLHGGFAGTTGPVIVTFEQDGAVWIPPPNATLAEADRDQLDAGGLYLSVASTELPDGALRGQLITGDIELFFTTLSGSEEVPPVATAATGMGALTFDPDTGDIVAHVRTFDLEGTFAHIHEAAAGLNGGILIGLEQDPDEADLWSSAAGATLDADGQAALAAAGLYFNVHTDENPFGEIRGQIVPDGIDVLFVALSGDEQVPPADTDASGVAAVTVDLDSGAIIVHANTVDLVEPTAAHVHEAPAGANGPVIVVLVQDTDVLTRWSSAPDATLTEAQLASYEASGLYVNVHTQANSGGEIRGQLIPPERPVPTVAFSDIQTQIFNPNCAQSGCHGESQPQEGMVLAAGSAFDAIVGVPSMQVPALLRIDPGNPDDSYLVQKVEGTAAQGERMPQGGPFLSAAQIDLLRQWVSDGAPPD